MKSQAPSLVVVDLTERHWRGCAIGVESAARFLAPDDPSTMRSNSGGSAYRGFAELLVHLVGDRLDGVSPPDRPPSSGPIGYAQPRYPLVDVVGKPSISAMRVPTRMQHEATLLICRTCRPNAPHLLAEDVVCEKPLRALDVSAVVNVVPHQLDQQRC